MECSRQEYWRGLPFPTPEDLPDPEIKPVSLVPPALTGRVFTTEPPGKSRKSPHRSPIKKSNRFRLMLCQTMYNTEEKGYIKKN